MKRVPLIIYLPFASKVPSLMTPMVRRGFDTATVSSNSASIIPSRIVKRCHKLSLPRLTECEAMCRIRNRSIEFQIRSETNRTLVANRGNRYYRSYVSGSSDSTNAPLGSKSRKLRAWFNLFWQLADCCQSKLRKRSTKFSSRAVIQR